MIAVIAAPVIEEILFRGIVLRSIRKFAPAWGAILISSVLFGVYHLNIVQAVYATLMGIAAGILYEKKRNLLFPILVHFANNLITMLQGFAPSEVNELISIFILIMIAPAGYIVCRSLRTGQKEQIACKGFIQCITCRGCCTSSIKRPGYLAKRLFTTLVFLLNVNSAE